MDQKFNQELVGSNTNSWWQLGLNLVTNWIIMNIKNQIDQKTKIVMFPTALSFQRHCIFMSAKLRLCTHVGRSLSLNYRKAKYSRSRTKHLWSLCRDVITMSSRSAPTFRFWCILYQWNILLYIAFLFTKRLKCAVAEQCSTLHVKRSWGRYRLD